MAWETGEISAISFLDNQEEKEPQVHLQDLDEGVESMLMWNFFLDSLCGRLRGVNRIVERLSFMYSALKVNMSEFRQEIIYPEHMYEQSVVQGML